MTAQVAAAFLAMGHQITREAAAMWAREAARRGATPAQLADAWAAWTDVEQQSVTTIRRHMDGELYDPFPDPISYQEWRQQ